MPTPREPTTPDVPGDLPHLPDDPATPAGPNDIPGGNPDDERRYKEDEDGTEDQAAATAEIIGTGI
jgi:hypothetical protein